MLVLVVRHAPVINNNNCCYGDNEVECDTSNQIDFINLLIVCQKMHRYLLLTLSRAKKHSKPQLRQVINMMHILKIHV